MEMLSIPAQSRDEAARADFLEQWIQKEGYLVKRIGNNLLLGDVSGKEKPAFLLCSHIDTVPPSKGWSGDPFKPQYSDGKITALGANDAGASVISMLAAFEHLVKLNGQYTPLLLLAAEEEVSGRNGIEAALPFIGNIETALVGEPTGMQPAVAQRGLMVVDALVAGLAGHAARNEGINAIMLAIKEIEKISKVCFPLKSDWLPEPSLQVTVIEGGSVHNVVPDECRFVIDVRSNDIYNNEDILQLLENSTSAVLKPRSTRLQARRLPADHFLNTVFTELGLEPFGSSTLSDMALLPFPSVKIGPGDSARSHTADEWISPEEIKKGIEGYIAIGKKIMGIK